MESNGRENEFQLPALENAIAWIGRQGERKTPKSISITTGDLREARNDWGHIEAFSDYSQLARLDAQVENNGVRVQLLHPGFRAVRRPLLVAVGARVLAAVCAVEVLDDVLHLHAARHRAAANDALVPAWIPLREWASEARAGIPFLGPLARGRRGHGVGAGGCRPGHACAVGLCDLGVAFGPERVADGTPAVGAIAGRCGVGLVFAEERDDVEGARGGAREPGEDVGVAEPGENADARARDEDADGGQLVGGGGGGSVKGGG